MPKLNKKSSKLVLLYVEKLIDMRSRASSSSNASNGITNEELGISQSEGALGKIFSESFRSMRKLKLCPWKPKILKSHFVESLSLEFSPF